MFFARARTPLCVFACVRACVYVCVWCVTRNAPVVINFILRIRRLKKIYVCSNLTIEKTLMKRAHTVPNRQMIKRSRIEYKKAPLRTPQIQGLPNQLQINRKARTNNKKTTGGIHLWRITFFLTPLSLSLSLSLSLARVRTCVARVRTCVRANVRACVCTCAHACVCAYMRA